LLFIYELADSTAIRPITDITRGTHELNMKQNRQLRTRICFTRLTGMVKIKTHLARNINKFTNCRNNRRQV